MSKKKWQRYKKTNNFTNNNCLYTLNSNGVAFDNRIDVDYINLGDTPWSNNMNISEILTNLYNRISILETRIVELETQI